jgi:glutaminyl-peptide cyclotransferase
MAKTEVPGRTSLKLLGGFLSLVLIFTACDSRKSSEKKTDQPEKKIPSFNADSAFHFVKTQVGFGPRVPGTEAHRKFGDFLVAKLKSYGMEVVEQKAPMKTYDGKTHTLRNIIGSFRPELGNRVLLIAHYDTRPFADNDSINKDKPADGADDGGSGVAVLLEVARQLYLNRPDIGVDFLFNDLEDYGQTRGNENTWCLGAQYWARNPHKEGYNASFGIVVDIVGGLDPNFPREGNSEKYAPHILNKVWNIAAMLGYSNYFSNARGPEITDDHVYINSIANIPTIDIISLNPKTGAFAPTHHRHSDNLENISRNSLQMVGQVILHTLYSQ